MPDRKPRSRPLTLVGTGRPVLTAEAARVLAELLLAVPREEDGRDRDRASG